MSIESNLSGHWTDEQMIGHLYGVGPQDNHLSGCQECGARLQQMQAHRRSLEGSEGELGSVSFEFLTAQRRAIYARLDEPVRWWAVPTVRRWVSGAVAVLVVGGGLTIYQERQQQNGFGVLPSNQTAQLRESDAQLAEEVSSLAGNAEPSSTDPLKALFAE